LTTTRARYNDLFTSGVKMKAYKLEVLVIDHEGYGADDVTVEIEQLGGWHTSVLSSKEADIGEWHDDHPLNSTSKQKEECERLFKE
jgi:hypothetical protein